MSTHQLPHGADTRDEGSVLTMILALMVVGSLAVLSLLTFATTLFTNRPPIEVRDQTFWTAKSAMSMAMTLQRESGPDGCYQATDSFTLNGYTANVTCTPTGQYFGTGRGRFAVITTSNDPTTVPLAGRGAGAQVKPITGDVLVNGGGFGSLTSDLSVSALGTGVVANVALSSYDSPTSPAARYNDPLAVPVPPATTGSPAECTNPNVIADLQFPNPGVDWSPVCQVAPWWDLAGDLNTDTGVYEYPELPPLPAYERFSVPQAVIGTCNVYFPGRYDDPLTLGSGNHFFPSGVYYFEDTVTLQPGARVVAGEGRWGGCTFDAEAAFAPTAPNFHSITGKGATFLLGGDARIEATDASLRINRRVSDSTSRGTETIAIRSVNFATSAPATPSPVEVPDDVVYVADVFDPDNGSCDNGLSTTLCLENAADHEVQLSSASPVATYTPSTLSTGDTIVSFNQSGGSAPTNQFVTDGYVFVPNARVVFSGGTNDNYRLRLTAGLVASSVSLDYERPPSAASNWFLGVLDEPIQRQVELFVSVTAPNGQRTESRAIMEVNVDESYAINGWTVDPNAQGPTPPTPTTPPTTTPGTTVPATTTPGTTVPATTTPPTTTPPTTVPPTTVPPSPGTIDAPCNVARENWTRDFGDNPWTAEFWDFDSLGASPSNPFPGAPDVTQTVNEVYKPNNANPPAGLGAGYADYYTARFSVTFEVGTACEMDFQRGSDDGMRIKVTNSSGTTTVMDDWGAYAYRTSTHNGIPLVAGTNTIVVEYFERSGESGYEVRWED